MIYNSEFKLRECDYCLGGGKVILDQEDDDDADPQVAPKIVFSVCWECDGTGNHDRGLEFMPLRDGAEGEEVVGIFAQGHPSPDHFLCCAMQFMATDQEWIEHFRHEIPEDPTPTVEFRTIREWWRTIEDPEDSGEFRMETVKPEDKHSYPVTFIRWS